MYSRASVIWTVMRTFSPNVSVVMPVIVARPGAPRLSVGGGDPAGRVTLQPPHHRAIVRMPMNTPERRWERFTCLSFLLVLAPQRERKRLGDEFILRIQILFLDDEAVILDCHDFATILAHIGLKGSKVTLAIRRLNECLPTQLTPNDSYKFQGRKIEAFERPKRSFRLAWLGTQHIRRCFLQQRF
jgi:hypothetical protein